MAAVAGGQGAGAAEPSTVAVQGGCSVPAAAVNPQERGRRAGRRRAAAAGGTVKAAVVLVNVATQTTAAVEPEQPPVPRSWSGARPAQERYREEAAIARITREQLGRAFVAGHTAMHNSFKWCHEHGHVPTDSLRQFDCDLELSRFYRANNV